MKSLRLLRSCDLREEDDWIHRAKMVRCDTGIIVRAGLQSGYPVTLVERGPRHKTGLYATLGAQGTLDAARRGDDANVNASPMVRRRGRRAVRRCRRVWPQPLAPDRRAPRLAQPQAGPRALVQRFNHLRPEVNKAEWTEQEDAIILVRMREYGKVVAGRWLGAAAARAGPAPGARRRVRLACRRAQRARQRARERRRLVHTARVGRPRTHDGRLLRLRRAADGSLGWCRGSGGDEAAMSMPPALVPAGYLASPEVEFEEYLAREAPGRGRPPFS
jgi:hypothetical protein